MRPRTDAGVSAWSDLAGTGAGTGESRATRLIDRSFMETAFDCLRRMTRHRQTEAAT